jgi:hypothetical protein
MKKRMLKVDPTKCKTLGEWLRRSGPYDIEACLLDIAAGVPLTYHDAVYLMLRALRKGDEIQIRAHQPYGPRAWDESIRNMCQASAPKAVGELLFNQFREGRKKKDEIWRLERNTWDWAHELMASAGFYHPDTPKTTDERVEYMRKCAESNIRDFSNGVRDMSVSGRLSVRLNRDMNSPGKTISFTQEYKTGGSPGQKYLNVEVAVPENIQTIMSVRRPLVFASAMYTPSLMTDTAVDIPTAKKALVLERKLVRYFGPACPVNALYEATWVRDAGTGVDHLKKEKGLMFSRQLLARMRNALGLYRNDGEPYSPTNRYAELFRNYYVTPNKTFIKEFMALASRDL